MIKAPVILISCFLILVSFFSCSINEDFNEDFDSLNDRIWISPELWSIPMENWQIKDGRLECIGSRKNMRVILLTHLLHNEGDFLINLRMGLMNKGNTPGSAGLILGITDPTDKDIRSLAYFGSGLNAGINTEGQLFLGDISEALPKNFDITDFVLHIDGYYVSNFVSVRLQATDKNGVSSIKIEKKDLETLEGAIAIVNNHPGENDFKGNNQFWFDDFNVAGSSLVQYDGNQYGPILWSMYTLNKGVLKMSVQMPPLGKEDNQEVELYFKEGEDWKLFGSEKIDESSRSAIFRVEGWDGSEDIPYRIVYREAYRNGKEKEYMRGGYIAREPSGRPLVMAGLTCQYNYGFPYKPLVKNLETINPDILYFSGDQIYEGNGGYGIIRFPADSAILNYLGKWYMFGWAFGDAMRNRPTVTIPDDHDVFQGNLWGDGGKNIPIDIFREYSGTSGGYVEPAEMINAVHRTQSGHLPDCYDTSPMDQGINPYFTELLYGRVSFAIVGDRMFKSGPKNVALWPGRKDHIKKALTDLSQINPPGLQLLGNRQVAFLEQWAKNWEGADIKCLLSQTLFANIATHHGGEKMVLYGDLDSGGWPISPRNRTIEILRSCFAYHIAGDQHLPSLVQYGIEEYKDAGWAFCTPAITVGYQRRFQPERIGLKISEPPAHGLPNTGKYLDPFGHPSFVYAIGNPDEETLDENRYLRAQKSSSGFGIIRFDQPSRKVTAEAYHFLADLSIANSSENQFPGWPHSVDLLDSGHGKIAVAKNSIKVDPNSEYVQIISEETGKLEYSFRPKNQIFIPWANNRGKFTVRVINTSGQIREISGVVLN